MIKEDCREYSEKKKMQPIIHITWNKLQWCFKEGPMKESKGLEVMKMGSATEGRAPSLQLLPFETKVK